jgi:hypothetical protein
MPASRNRMRLLPFIEKKYLKHDLADLKTSSLFKGGYFVNISKC